MTPIFGEPGTRRRRRPPLPAGTVRAYFYDEAPRIGSGWRLVEVLSVGPKWARLRDVSTDVGARLPREDWNPIAKHARPVLQ